MKRSRPALITDAERSQDDQLHSREIRYVLMMLIRVVCLVAAAVLVGAHAPLLWLWIPICLVGMILVPWLAVLLANDRPPKDRHRLANKFQRAAPAQPPQQAISSGEPSRVIDHEG